MKYGLCIAGFVPFLRAGKVYELGEQFNCFGQVLYEVPSTFRGPKGLCVSCGRDSGMGWRADRFVPINDADLIDEKTPEEITA